MHGNAWAFFLKEQCANITTGWCSLEKTTNQSTIGLFPFSVINLNISLNIDLYRPDFIAPCYGNVGELFN